MTYSPGYFRRPAYDPGRAYNASGAVEAYRARKGVARKPPATLDAVESELVDLIADLSHLARREGSNFNRLLRHAGVILEAEPA